MIDIPKELYYTQTHEWIRVEDDDVLTVGITDYAQAQLGDIVFVELPELNAELGMGDEVAVVESVKTAADIYNPLAGEIIAINEELTAKPQTINLDPYHSGWIYKIKLSNELHLDALMDANAYSEKTAEED